MRLRIGCAQESGLTVVRIDGELTDAGIGELREVCEAIGESPVLDLTDLVTADEAGLEALLGMMRDGATLRGGSPYLNLLIERRCSGKGKEQG
jgi:anti-anti-sigma regulatory factor